MNKNKDEKNPVIDDVLNETPPDFEEPVEKEEELPENVDPNPDVDPEPEQDTEPSNPPVEPVEKPEESEDQKDQRYREQQAETQITKARNDELVEKVDEAGKLPEPTIEELTTYSNSQGVNWNDMTKIEQIAFKNAYMAEKRFSIVNEAVQSARKIDEWATKVDTFLDSTEGKPAYLQLNGHEAEFRKFAMQGTHRGVDIEDILLPAFIHKLPPTRSSRSSIFQRGGGGEREVVKKELEDADKVAALRKTDSREYRRKIKAGQVQIEI